MNAFAAKKAWAKHDTTNKTFTFYYTDKGTLGSGEYEVYMDNTIPGWKDKEGIYDVIKVVFDKSFADVSPKYCGYWFYGFASLSTIEGIEYLNTSQVVSMSSMFSGCEFLRTVDLSHFNTSKVKDMSRMFKGCTRLNLSSLNFDTSLVSSMGSMFSQCNSLTSLDLSAFNTAKLTSLNNMFFRCSNLTTVDLSSFNTSLVKNSYNMFCECYRLETIYAEEEFSLNDDVSSDYMFKGCTKLKGAIPYNSQYVDKTYAKVDGGYFTDKVYTRPWVNYADGTLTFKYGYKKTLGSDEYLLNTGKTAPGWEPKNSNVTKVVFEQMFGEARPTSCYYWFHGCNQLDSKNITGLNYLNTSEVKTFRDMFWNCAKFTTLDLSSFNTEKCEDMAGMFNACSGLTSLNISKFKTDNVTDMIYMFYNCTALGTLNISNFNTANVTSMQNMFYGCSALKTLNLANFNTAKVTDMNHMFDGCSKLKSLSLSNNFNTENVKDMQYMFSNCSALKTLNLSSFNTAKVTDMNHMFTGCSALESVGLSSFTTPSLENMYYMFSGCSALKSLDLSKFNTEKITSMTRLFENCSSLESLNISGFNTANVTSAPSMFNGCSSLKTIDVSRFNTAKIDNMGHMFANCLSLDTLDLTNFNTSAVKWIDNMFINCSNLTTIYASENFALGSVQKSAGMFTGCTKLVGAIAYDANTVDKTYAKLDGGYFTDKNCPPRPWVKYADGTLTFQYGYKKTLGNGEYEMNEEWADPAWYSKRENVTKVVFDNTFAYARPTTCYCWFAHNTSLTDIEGIENLNTSESTVMNSMFLKCDNLNSLDLSNFDTRKVTNMNYMFKDCSNLKNIYVSDKFVGGSTVAFAPSSTVFYCSPVQYNATKEIAAFASNTVRPYVPINAIAEYGTLCVPLGSTLAESSFSGFDKLYRIKTADADKGVVTMEETESIEPGVPYVYRINLPEDATESIITFDVDASAATATAPKNDDSLLKGTFELITAPGGCYILQTDGKFHPVAAGNTTIGVGAYRAYLDLSSLESGNAKAFRMVFEDKETTGVNGVSDQMERQPKTCYDLMGRRVTTPKRGELYIVNGKKVVYNK